VRALGAVFNSDYVSECFNSQPIDRETEFLGKAIRDALQSV